MISLKLNDCFSDIDGRVIIEVKQSLSKPKVVDQTVSQAIVFSYIQEEKYPGAYSFVPNILISRNEFRIIMYNAKNILICSQPLDIFKGSSLNESSIIILWMVLHYGLFLKRENSLFREADTDTDTRFHNLRAMFKDRAASVLTSYQNDGCFPAVEKDSFPSLNILLDTEDVFQTT